MLIATGSVTTLRLSRESQPSLTIIPCGLYTACRLAEIGGSVDDCWIPVGWRGVGQGGRSCALLLSLTRSILVCLVVDFEALALWRHKFAVEERHRGITQTEVFLRIDSTRETSGG